MLYNIYKSNPCNFLNMSFIEDIIKKRIFKITFNAITTSLFVYKEKQL